MIVNTNKKKFEEMTIPSDKFIKTKSIALHRKTNNGREVEDARRFFFKKLKTKSIQKETK